MKRFFIALALLTCGPLSAQQDLFCTGTSVLGGAWRDDTAATVSTSDAHLVVDETTRDDADHLRSPTNQTYAATQFRCPVTDPAESPDTSAGTTWTVTAALDKAATGGPVISARIRLYQGTTALATAQFDDLANGFAEYTLTLSDVEIATVTDADDLEAQVSFSEDSGTGNRAGRVSWVKVTVPDAAAAGPTRNRPRLISWLNPYGLGYAW